MKAVNLIPAEARRGSGTAGKSGGAVYVILGALSLLVIAVAMSTLASRTVADRTVQLADLKQQVAAERERAEELTAFANFKSLREKRVQTVTSLAASRFDWGAALHEVSRVVPRNVWLTRLTATIAPGVSVGGSSAGGLRDALPVPAIELSGCTTSQPAVARTMTAMRRIDGVSQVSLASSEKSEAVGGGGSSSGDGDCRQGRAKFPQFSIVVYFDAPPTAAAPGAPATVGTTAPAGTAPASTTAPAPASGQGASK